jgi:alkylation response protein AidB-like acyl-CoA dehydrogenase
MLFDSEQQLLADTARDFFAQNAPPAALRKLRDVRDQLGYEPEVWRRMVDLGWSAIIFPEAHGGLDFGYKGLGAVFEQAGRCLAATPLFGTVALGGSAVMLGGSEQQKAQWLPGIIAGESLFALAVDEKSRHDPLAVATSAVASADGFIFNGTKSFVVDGGIADQLVVVARSAGSPGVVEGLSLFVVDAKAAGVTRRERNLVDSRNMAAISFDQVRVPAASLLGQAGQGGELLDAVLDRARVCLSAEMLGAAGWLFDTTVAYLKERIQFDVPIGSFQALQHRAAKMFTDLELARSAVEAALQAIDADSPDVAELVSLSKAKMGDVFHLVSNEMVQMHGGIGMTDAHDSGFYLKRARAAEAAFGSQSYHRDRYARINGY